VDFYHLLADVTAIRSGAPSHGTPGVTTVTLSCRGFGAAQGTGGQIWLGTASGVVQNWSDTLVVATVGAGAYTGSARILQGCVMSNAKAFTVNRLHITDVTPGEGVPGTLVTITGTGFGATRGSGTVTLGSADGVDVLWSDTAITARVAATSLTGSAQVFRNGEASNAKQFIVPVAGGNTLVPNVVQMMVGEARTLQALSATGQTVTGLTWTSSDLALVSLSAEDPPVLTALAAGRVTITAGTATASVTVSDAGTLPGGALPPGTVLWSNPGNGSGVTRIVPAVPSPSGVADVFAFQNDGTVQAITADGTTAWTAYVGDAEAVPDFQGGMVVSKGNSIWRLDGITGQPYPAYQPERASLGKVAVHTDGTIFAQQDNYSGDPNNEYDTGSWAVVGIDPATGAPKFSAPLLNIEDHPYYFEGRQLYSLIIAGDGHAYALYATFDRWNKTVHLRLLRVDTSGAYEDVSIKDFPTKLGNWADTLSANLITNVDQGVLITWYMDPNSTDGLQAGFNGERRTGRGSGAGKVPLVEGDLPVDIGMATTTGGAVSLMSAPRIPGQEWAVEPVLQAQDGSFVGSVWAGENGNTPNMVAFDATGNVRWTVPGYGPKIALADGGVIAQAWDPDAQDFTGPAVTFDENGNATGMMGDLPTYSWMGNAYELNALGRSSAAPPVDPPPGPLGLSASAMVHASNRETTHRTPNILAPRVDTTSPIGLVSRIRIPMVDFGLSFAPFQGGSLSPNGSSVKLVQSKMFIPYQINDAPGQDALFFETVKANPAISAPKVANELLEYRKASETGFKDALATTNSVVAFIGHAQLAQANATNSIGLCFPSKPGDLCAVPKPLTIVTTGDGNQAVLNPPDQVRWDILENGFTPKAKVVFLAACGLDANFIAQWHLQPGQALIVPVYNVPSENLHMDLYKAGLEWQYMLEQLADGKSVSEAVVEGNWAVANRTHTAHSWRVIGDGSVNFCASK
jgi:hypothetical protein